MKGRAYSSSRSAIISLLLEQGELSRAEIARRTGLSRAAISLSTSELIEEGLVQEIGTTVSTGGRKPVLIRLGGEAKFAVGVAYESGSCIFSLVNLDGVVIDHQILPDTIPTSANAIIETITSQLPIILGKHSTDSLLGLGLSLSGQINSLSDRFTSIIWGIRDSTLRSDLERIIDVPVVILDNAHAAGLGELWIKGREYREHLMYLYMGIGTGGAIITGRDLYTGRNNTAGEIGQMIIDIDGPDFGCHRGCFEGFLAYDNLRNVIAEQRSAGMSTILPEELPDRILVPEIARAAELEDPLANFVLGYCARYVGVQAANMLALLNPDEIILGGPFGLWGERFVSLVTAEVERLAMPITFAEASIVGGSPSTETIPLGAAAMIIRLAPDLLSPTASDLKPMVRSKRRHVLEPV
jgi:predicted NBD/HSP70 family sugar kinase/biotin operon repressor